MKKTIVKSHLRKRKVVRSHLRVYKKGKYITTRSPKEVLKIGHEVKSKLKPYSQRIELAGSVRRKKPANDIDLVLIPKDKNKIKNKLESIGAKIIASGDKQIFSKYKGTKVDVFFADKDNWPAQLLTRTGSSGHNIGLRKQAQTLGLKLNEKGIFNRKTGQIIKTKTERDIYKILKRPKYKQPWERN